MKRILPYSLILVSAGAAYACSDSSSSGSSGSSGNITPDEDSGIVGDTDGGGGGDGGDGGPIVKPGTEDPTGNPILLGGAPRVVRTFTPGGGAPPHFVDGPAWARDALYVALPFATNLSNQKGILASFKADGTSYLELRGGDKVSTGVVGNSVDANGNLISAELSSVTRTEANGTVTVIATAAGDDAGAGVSGFQGPNDLVALADGTILVTDPGYNVTPRPANGYLWKLDATTAAVFPVTATAAVTYSNNPSPNGIALSKDQKFLFVGFTAPAAPELPYVRLYAVGAGGTLDDKGKLFELPADSQPDGLATDDNNNIYVCLKTGIAVYKTVLTGTPSAEPYGGAAAKVPQTTISEEPTGMTFGGADRKSLFVTTKGGKVLELKTKTAGLLH